MEAYFRKIFLGNLSSSSPRVSVPVVETPLINKGFKAAHPHSPTVSTPPTWRNDGALELNGGISQLKHSKATTELCGLVKSARPPFSRGSSFSSVSSDSSTFSTSTTSTTTSIPSLSILKKPGARPAWKTAFKAKCRVSFTNPLKRSSVFIHPLFACSESHRSPIHFEASAPPTKETLIDHVGEAIPVTTLLEPATEPPTRGKLELATKELPWTITVHASGNTSSPQAVADPADYKNFDGPAPRLLASARPRFYIDDGGSDESDDTEEPAESDDYDDGEDDGTMKESVVSNLDVLCAVYTTLAMPVTHKEWDVLGDGSHEQRKIARAYERRCQDAGGGWDEGVKRVDFLKGKSVLVGIEASQRGEKGYEEEMEQCQGPVGCLVFSG
ncbi:hypothetical protein FA15DRAFT_241225 [Coprinopsis marcescibilis]|uniref:DUF6699 domain-containing protein n=1 Tax=Coprinopsis marcescibilis TaxID=230819 RepID=A0A5C3KFS8_COPMA|nr:hypothetical protein FA15DRAFT_241225 [Coprinopsis marcescibilis]